MQRILLGLLAIFLVAACSTPQATSNTGMADKPMTAPTAGTMKDDFRSKPPTPGEAPEIKLGDFQDFKLDNGLQVVLVENHKLPRISYQLFVDVPPHLEGDKAGVSDMMGQMLRRATSTKTKEEIDEAIDFIGASLSTGGSGAYGATITKYKETLLDMMREVVLDARFPEEEFAKVKSDAQANLESALGNPSAIANRVRQVVTYGEDHPYGELTTKESLDNITLDDVKAYYNTYFTPNRSYLVMVGDLTRADAEMLAKKAFGDWEAKEVPTPEFEMPARPQGLTVNFVPRPGAVQSNVIFSKPLELQPGTKQDLRGGILNRIFGTGFNGRLNQNIREKNAYAYGAGSSLSSGELVGNFRASSDVRAEVTDSAVAEFITEFEKIVADPVTAEELNRAKSQIAGSFGRALESPQQIASYALNTIRYGLDRDYYPSYLQKVEASSASDLQEVARKTMDPRSMHLIVVGPKEMGEKLARFATSGVVNYYDANGNKLAAENMDTAVDEEAKQVIMKYVRAIGGDGAIKAIKNYSLTMEADVQGQTMTQTLVKEGNERMASVTSAGGMTMMEQRYNDGKGKMIMQGQELPANPMIDAALKGETALFPVVAMLEDMDAVTMKGTETLNGKEVAVITVVTPTGSSDHYFDVASGLEVRSVKSAMGQKVTTDLSDYKDVGGVLMPHTLTQTGAAPFPIEMKVTKAEVNTTLDQTQFAVH